ncbi:MAG: hypothetical protein PWP65_1740 [Clostridia bacterium]|nr:hypothetical protein [Clostridia bacterium]
MFPRKLLTCLIFLTLFLPAFCALITPQTSWAGAFQGQAVVVLLDRTSFPEIMAAPAPNLHRLLQEGAVALMNTNNAGKKAPAGAWATLGAGRPALAPEEKAQAYNRWEKYGHEDAGSAYRRRLGGRGGTVVVPEIYALQQANRQARTGAEIGALGEALSSASLKIAVLGNADLPEKKERLAGLLGCDSRGSIPLGDVGPDLVRPGEGVLPFRTDYPRLIKAFKELKDQADLIIIDLGDTARLDNLAPGARPEIIAAEKERIFKEIDNFLGELQKIALENKASLLLVSPYPGREALEKNNSLGFIALAGPGIGPGLLTSPTTRRPGLVANIDLAPTLLAGFGLTPPPSFSGRPFHPVEAAGALDFLLAENQRIVALHNLRPAVIKTYIGLQIILLAAILLLLLWRPRLTYYLRPFLLWLGAVPLAMLFLGASNPVPDGILYPLYVAGLSALLALAASRWSPTDLGAWGLLAGGTTLAIMLDIAAGSRLMSYSLLGYDPLAGARYYGLGNEYAGVLLGAAIFSSTAFLELTKGKNSRLPHLFLPFFLLLIYLSGSPSLGADFGATVAGLTAAIFTWLQIKGRSLNWRLVLTAAAITLFITASFFCWDLNRPVLAQSHLGRAASMVKVGDFSGLYQMAVGKVAMNLKLIRYTIWSRILLVSLAVLGMIAYRPVGVLRKLSLEYPLLFGGFKGLFVAGAALLVANDSGIVAAATLSIFGVPPLVYLAVGQSERK